MKRKDMNFFRFLKLRKKNTPLVLITSFFLLLAFANAGVLFAAAPTVVTGAASSVTKTAASLSGTISSHGGAEITETGFNYGTTTGYGSSVTATTTYSALSPMFATSGATEGLVNAPYGMAIDSSGNIYVADGDNHRIQKFNSSGVFQMMFGRGVDTGATALEVCTSGCQAGSTGTGNGELNAPWGVTVDSSGNIYVADTGNHRIQKFNSAGGFIAKLGGTAAGATEGAFNTPIGITLDGSGNVLVSDTNNNRIQKLNSSLAFQAMYGRGVDTGATSFETCTASCETGSSGSGSGEFNQPIGIDFDSSGNLFVADLNNNRVQKFNSSFVHQLSFGTPTGSGNGFLAGPTGLYIDANDRLYVTEVAANDRVQKFNTSGTFLKKFGSLGSGSGQFTLAVGIVVDASGNIYVSDYTLDRIQKFNLSIDATQITGLSCGTTYHFQAYATNSDGIAVGSDATFDTSPCQEPEVETVSATNATQTTATLNGKYIDMPVVPGVTRGFQYGLTVSYGSTVSENGKEYVSQFNTGSVAFSGPQGISLDSSGNIYVVDSGNNRVQKFNSSGTWVLDIVGSGGAFNNPYNVYVDASDNVYVSDTGNGRVQKFDSSGNILIPDIGLGTIGTVFSVAVNSGGDIYITDPDNVRVAKFNSSGAYIGDFASGEVVIPTSMDFDSSGNVYVADPVYTAVRKFDSSGTPLIDIGTSESLSAVSFTVSVDANDNVYVTDPDTPHVLKYNTSGTLLYNLGNVSGSGNGELNTPGFAVGDASGNIYVTDSSNNRVQKFNLNFSLPVSSLDCGSTYNYRAFATNADGAGYGVDKTFSTASCGGGGGSVDIFGCTNPLAFNYNPNATIDNGTCSFEDPSLGCTDPDATNYDPDAVVNDPLDPCIYDPGAIPGCTDPSAGNYNSSATVDNGSCLYGVFGCMDPTATNYNPAAQYGDGSCNYPGGGGSDIFGCMNSAAVNFNPAADIDDGTCNFTVPLVYGCMDVEASNFNFAANADDGSCSYIGEPDTDIFGEVIGGATGVVKEIPEEILVGVSVAGIVGPGILLNFLQPGLLIGLLSIPIRLWNLIPVLMGYKRKKRPWGTVYDSVTKQPLDPVYVTLNAMAGAEVGSSITDLDGRYGFLAEAGTYNLSANKANYIFPSAKLAGKSEDQLYDNLYFGGPVELAEKEGVIFKNIPMDAINFNWNEFAKASNKKLMKFYSKRDFFFARTAKTLFIAGFVSSLALFLVNNSTLNTVILSLYALIIILRLFGIKPKQSGYAYDKDGDPLSFGIIKLFSAELEREVAHTVVGKTGRYYMLVPNGYYYMKVSKKTGEDSYEDVLISDSFRVKSGYVKEKIYI